MADITLHQIRKSYGNTMVLDGLSLTIRDGEFLTLLGASGCGKSTLLKLLAGLEHPDSGAMHQGTDDMLRRSPADHDCAMVFQSYALYPHMTVRDNVCTPLYMRQLNLWQRLPGMRWISPRTRRSIHAAQAQGLRVAATLGIESLWLRKPAQLSGGQRQRVALARAMVRSPSLFLFDEPLSNLDANLRQTLRGEIRQLHDALGATFVYVTHDQHEAMSMSDRVAVMSAGRILQLGTPTEIYEKPAHRDVAAFVGAPRINFLAIRPDTAYDSDFQYRIRHHLRDSQVAEVAFRPHAAQLAPVQNALAVSGRIAAIEFTGAERLVTLQTDTGERLIVSVDHAAALHLHAPLTLYVPQSQLHAFDAQGKRVAIAACSQLAAA